MDQSFCKSDKGVGNSFVVDNNNVLGGLEDEENEDNNSRSMN